MIPYLLRPTALPTGSVLPMLVIANQTHAEPDEYDDDDDDDDGDDDEEEDFIEHDYSPSPINIPSGSVPFITTTLPQFAHADRHVLPFVPIDDSNEQGTFRLRMNVDDFQPHELHVSIRHSRLIIRGKHVVRAPNQTHAQLTTSSHPNHNDDTEPDFISKEFKRTFMIPSNTDIRKAHAQFYPQQHLLVVEIPFQDSSDLSTVRTLQRRVRPLDVFLTLVYALLMDRALCIAYEQYMIDQYSSYEYI